MRKQVSTGILVTLLLTIALAKELPINLLTSHSPHAFLLKAEVEPDTQLSIFSKQLRRQGDHWTTLSTRGSNIEFKPQLDSEQVLFNQKHEGKYHLAFYLKVDASEKQHHNKHFLISKVKHEGNAYDLLLPIFHHDMPAIRADALYRCSNTLVSVEWKKGDAHIVAFSKHDPWKILESIDNGFSSEEKSVHYGKAIDQGHTHPVKIEVGFKKYCLIDRNTKVSSINLDFSLQYYDLDTFLDLVGPSLLIKSGQDLDEDLDEDL